MRSKELNQLSSPSTPNNTFGLGIQVYKIESILPRINSGKNQRRQLIKQLQNPGFSKKYDKNVNSSYEKIQEREVKESLREANLDIRKRSVKNSRSSTTNKIVIKERQRPPSGKVLARVTKREKVATPKPTNTKQQLDAGTQKSVITRNYPPLQHQQLKPLDDKINQISNRRKQLRKALKKQLKTTRDEAEQQKIIRKLQLIDKVEVIQEMVNSQELTPYDIQEEFQYFGLEQYLQRQQGEFVVGDQQDQTEPEYHPIVYVSQKQEQAKEETIEQVEVDKIKIKQQRLAENQQ